MVVNIVLNLRGEYAVNVAIPKAFLVRSAVAIIVIGPRAAAFTFLLHARRKFSSEHAQWVFICLNYDCSNIAVPLTHTHTLHTNILVFLFIFQMLPFRGIAGPY